MDNHRFYMVREDALPTVIRKVTEAKKLLETGKAGSVTKAVSMAGLSRSTFYKYKNCVFEPLTGAREMKLRAVILDEPGALQMLLQEISKAGGQVVQANLSAPEKKKARAHVSLRTDIMQIPADELLIKCRRLPCVFECFYE